MLLAGPVPAAALVVAAGLHPVELVPDPAAPTPRLDALAGDVALTARDGRWSSRCSPAPAPSPGS